MELGKTSIAEWTGKNKQTGFELKTLDKSMVFVCSSPTEAKEWISDLSQAIQAEKESQLERFKRKMEARMKKAASRDRSGSGSGNLRERRMGSLKALHEKRRATMAGAFDKVGEEDEDALAAEEEA